MTDTTKRYVPNGVALTPYEAEVLTIMVEEAAEVIQAATKLIRFGKENRPTDDALPNTRVLGLELGDLQRMVTLARYAGLVGHGDMLQGVRRKAERLETYMQNSPPSPAAIVEERNERWLARKLAAAWLDYPHGVGDPDSDECMLARQYLRALEKIARQAKIVGMLEGRISGAETADVWPSVDPTHGEGQ